MKKLFLYLSIGITILAIPITVFVAGKNSEVRKRAAPATTLSLVPSSLTRKAGETFSLEVKIDTASNQVGIIQLKILYDPAYLEAQDITNGPLAPSIRVSKKIDPNGQVSITVGAKDNTHPITGIGTIAVLTMKAVASSASPVIVKFAPAPDTFGNAIGEGDHDVIIGRTPATVTILNADGTTKTTTETGTPTPTLSPTLTPLDEATDSGELASSSALLITSPVENEDVVSDTPTIEGKADPGSTVTVVIYSDPQTGIVTVNSDGTWSYKPTTPLEPGPHTVEAIVTDPNTGETQTVTISFVVASQGGTNDVDSGSDIPASGSIETTIFLAALGVLLLISGAFVPLFIR